MHLVARFVDASPEAAASLLPPLTSRILSLVRLRCAPGSRCGACFGNAYAKWMLPALYNAQGGAVNKINYSECC